MSIEPLSFPSKFNILNFVGICKSLYIRALNSKVMKTQLVTLLMVLSPLFLISSDSENVFELICPNDVWVDCDAELWDLSVYGNAYYKDYSGATYSAGSSWDSHHINSCGTGYIVREWSIEDPYWNIHTCTQIIWVEGGSFSYHNIHWPKDIVLEGCQTGTEPKDLPYGHGEPHFDYVECSHIGTSFKDQLFHFGPDCFKIIREWTIIDWCTYDPNAWGNNNGYYEFTQVIKVSNSDKPNIYCPTDIKVESYDCGNEAVTVPKVNVDHSVCGGYYSVVHNSPYAFKEGDDASGIYPIGTTKVIYSIEYGCGLTTTCSVNVIVQDAKKPVAYCYASLSIALMPIDNNGDGDPDEGMVTIWASDINKDSYHPCGHGSLTFAFSEDIYDTNKTFTCEDVGSNTVQMYVIDENGLYSFCEVEIIVQNNFPHIPNCEEAPVPRAAVTGHVMDPQGAGMEDTSIFLEEELEEMVITEEIVSEEYIETVLDSFYNQEGHFVHTYTIDTIFTYSYDTTYVTNQRTALTNEEGNYVFEDVSMNTMLHLSAEREECDLSKITLVDAQILFAHIIGEITFDHPYQYLAADVDDSKSVNFNDLTYMIRFLTGEIEALPCKKSYWYVQEGTSMDGNPFDVAMEKPIEVMMEEPVEVNHNIIAVMKGDIDKLIDEGLLQTIIDNSTLEDLNLFTDVDDVTSNEVLRINPNPVSDVAQLTIESSVSGMHSVEVYDLAGKVLTSIQKNKSGSFLSFSIDVSNFSPGAYVVKVSSKDNIWTKKILVD